MLIISGCRLAAPWARARPTLTSHDATGSLLRGCGHGELLSILCVLNGRPVTGSDCHDDRRDTGIAQAGSGSLQAEVPVAQAICSAPKVLETTNRYNENDVVNKRVHELAFGIVMCFGSEG